MLVGVHHGPAIAMTANGRLDYFGRTVNPAAQIADSSRGGDVVMLRQAVDEANRSLIGGHGVTTESLDDLLTGNPAGRRIDG